MSDGQKKSSLTNTLRYRIRNSCGQDGKVLRIACLTTCAILLVLFGVLIASIGGKNKNGTELEVQGENPLINGVRHPKNNGYNDFDWNQLPKPIQAAASELGYNEYLWDEGIQSEPFKKEWNELSAKELNAASLLGWDEETWCTDYDDDIMVGRDPSEEGTYEPTSEGSYVATEEYTSGSTSEDYTSEPTEDNTSEPTEGDSTEAPTSEVSGLLRDEVWADLPPDVQAAAKKFGFTQDNWDNDIPVIGLVSDWDELSPDMKAAALILGYDEDSWCDEQQRSWLDQTWADLPPSIQSAATVLGYNEELWNNDGSSDITQLEWSDLSPAQQNAASIIGYDEDSWNGSDRRLRRRRHRGLSSLRGSRVE